ncbi:MAG: tetratricopeptide repeat protein [Gemmatimonadetes bacterium]|nr:tetratricopeptide repeat protein [Gemmatimonadota bacterium]MBT4613191.1 tetratricopeptide repeat protein [Gemmatimonadota bacterium]MBT5057468.1 tetratricopeptide repeat protein [Gemmatimonadota bacterium]MBT5143613.1 tetratricopeptide repeat protein [Gemmatimonadota bacterium]MBT5588901.1 tetratricopeptide repeat protein [Gemmatimonadota bacterium]
MTHSTAGLARSVWVAAGLFVGTAALFAPTLDHGFVYDDSHSIVDNVRLRDWQQIPTYFVDPAAFSVMPQAQMYRPILLTTYAVNFALDGPSGFHLVNVLLHAGAAVLLWYLLGSLGFSRSVALGSAVLFAVHPLTTEPVNYISSRSSSLSALWLLTAAIAIAGPRRSFQALRMAVWTLMGVLTKATGVVIAPLVVWYLVTAGQLRRWRLILGPVVVSLLYLSYTRSIVAKAMFDPVRDYAAAWSTQLKTLPFYLHTMSMPTRLSIEPQFGVSSGPFSIVVAASMFLVVSACAMVWLMRHQDWRFSFGAGWFFLALVPTLLVPLNILVNEHRLYAALPGAIICLAVLLTHLPRARSWLVLATVLLALLSTQRNQAWSSPNTIWKDAIARGPLMPRPHVNLGKVLLEQGQYEEAIEATMAGLNLNPGLARGHYNIATASLHLRRLEQAIASFERALEIDPQMMEAWNNLGNTYKELGRYQEAVEAYRHALTVRPSRSIYHNLGSTFLAASLYDSAAIYFDKALRLQKQTESAGGGRETYIGLARSLRRGQRLPESVRALTEALQDYPLDVGLLELLAQTQAALGYHDQALATYGRTDKPLPEIHLRLGQVALQRADSKLAERHFERGLLAKPDDARLHNALGEVRLLQGDRDLALAAFRRAARLEPTLSVAFRNIGLVYLHHKRHVEALAALERARQHETEGGEAKTWELLAHVHEGLDDIPMAIHAYERALERAPERAILYYNLGVLHNRSGATRQGQRLLRQALDRDPTLAVAQD